MRLHPFPRGEGFLQLLLDFFRREFAGRLGRRLGWCPDMRKRPVEICEQFCVFFWCGQGSMAFHVRYHNTSMTPRKPRKGFCASFPFVAERISFSEVATHDLQVRHCPERLQCEPAPSANATRQLANGIAFPFHRLSGRPQRPSQSLNRRPGMRG
jgi:hypothetical protein